MNSVNNASGSYWQEFCIKSSSGTPGVPPAKSLHIALKGFIFMQDAANINQLVEYPYEA